MASAFAPGGDGAALELRRSSVLRVSRGRGAQRARVGRVLGRLVVEAAVGQYFQPMQPRSPHESLGVALSVPTGRLRDERRGRAEGRRGSGYLSAEGSSRGSLRRARTDSSKERRSFSPLIAASGRVRSNVGGCEFEASRRGRRRRRRGRDSNPSNLPYSRAPGPLEHEGIAVASTLRARDDHVARDARGRSREDVRRLVHCTDVDHPAHELTASVAAREPAAPPDREMHVASGLEQLQADLAPGLTAADDRALRRPGGRRGCGRRTCASGRDCAAASRAARSASGCWNAPVATTTLRACEHVVGELELEAVVARSQRRHVSLARTGAPMSSA